MVVPPWPRNQPQRYATQAVTQSRYRSGWKFFRNHHHHSWFFNAKSGGLQRTAMVTGLCTFLGLIIDQCLSTINHSQPFSYHSQPFLTIPNHSQPFFKQMLCGIIVGIFPSFLQTIVPNQSLAYHDWAPISNNQLTFIDHPLTTS